MAAATATAATSYSLTPAEVEELHLRLATAASLQDDPNDCTEGFISDILAGRAEPAPLYNRNYASVDDDLRRQIADNDMRVWNAVFAAIENGQIDVLDNFISLGFDITLRHPRTQNYPIHVAVKASQTNIMRHLINLHADVNAWCCDYPLGCIVSVLDPITARTPLMIAAEQGNLNICKILCETAFADPMLIAPDGQTAQRLAARNGHKQIVQYLPVHRGGTWTRLRYDYNHRWTFIRRTSKGIYYFFRVLLYEIPKFFLYTIPKEILNNIGEGLLKLVHAIPPAKQWPRVLKRKLENFLIVLTRVIKMTPKTIYKTTKNIIKQTYKRIKRIPYLVKITAQKTWNSLKAIPSLVKNGATKVWLGLKVVISWIVDLVLNILSFLHTVVSAIADFFRSITLVDILNGLKTVLCSIFITLPQMLWSALKSLGRGVENTLVWMFGTLYWIVKWTLWVLQWVALYVPKKLAWIVVSIAGGIGKAFLEMWVWISPRSMV